jgi:hypothetical protein
MPSLLSHIHTAFCDLGECQAGAALEVDVLGKHQGAEGAEGLPREEVGFAALRSKAMSIHEKQEGFGGSTNVF